MGPGPGVMEPDENFCLRWNDYEKKYAETFRTLREDDHFAGGSSLNLSSSLIHFLFRPRRYPSVRGRGCQGAPHHPVRVLGLLLPAAAHHSSHTASRPPPLGRAAQ